MKKISSIFIALILFCFSCVETEPVSPIPQITFKSFELFDYYDTLLQNYITRGVLEFSFIDGDADLGYYGEIDTNDQNLENNYNLFLTPFEKQNGEYLQIELDSNLPPPYYRISHDSKFDRIGQNKTIKGTIRINIDYFLHPEYDTMRYEFYMLDRARNKSNVETTSDISFIGLGT